MKNFLHERDDFSQLLNIVAREMQINDPSLVEAIKNVLTKFEIGVA